MGPRATSTRSSAARRGKSDIPRPPRSLGNGEPEYVGVTIHRLNPGIDAGEIFAVAHPQVDRDEAEDTLFAKCVRKGWSQYEGAGHREYRSVERTISSEYRTEKLLKVGLLRRFADGRDH